MVSNSPPPLPLRNHVRSLCDGLWRKICLLPRLLHYPSIRNHDRILRPEFPRIADGPIDQKHDTRIAYQRNSEAEAGRYNANVDDIKKILPTNGQHISHCDTLKNQEICTKNIKDQDDAVSTIRTRSGPFHVLDEKAHGRRTPGILNRC